MRKHKREIYKRIARHVAVEKWLNQIDMAMMDAFDKLYGSDFEVLVEQCKTDKTAELFKQALDVLEEVKHG